MKRVEATISGRVQGVSFRYYTAKKAASLGLTGWVRNEPNGNVLTVAEGADELIQQFIEFLHDGSPQAHVQSVATRWQEATGEWSQFKVQYHS